MAEPDVERLDLRAPLPEGAEFARVVFKLVRNGPERTVKRSVATHADVMLEFEGRRTETRRVTAAAAEAFIAEAARLNAEG
jgi:hypothetical protein